MNSNRKVDCTLQTGYVQSSEELSLLLLVGIFYQTQAAGAHLWHQNAFWEETFSAQRVKIDQMANFSGSLGRESSKSFLKFLTKLRRK